MENPIVCTFVFLFLIVILILIILITISIKNMNEIQSNEEYQSGYCPVSKNPLPKKPIKVKIKGKIIHLCSRNCIPKAIIMPT